MTNRFYCENCSTPIPERRVKLVRLLPVTRAPWPLFEYLEKPVCPVCDRDLLDMMWTGAGHDNPERTTPLSRIIGAMPDLPDGFPRDDGTYTTPPECLADGDKQQQESDK